MSSNLSVHLVQPTLFDATVIIAGISIVVGVLILLILIFNLFGIIVPKIEAVSRKLEDNKKAKKAKKLAKKNNKASVEDKENIDNAPAVKPVQATPPAPAPAVEQGISGEVVAAIAAAVVASEGPTAVIRSIKKKNVGGRNPWSQAANIDNTRPF